MRVNASSSAGSESVEARVGISPTGSQEPIRRSTGEGAMSERDVQDQPVEGAVCDVCGMRFDTEDDLQEHIVKAHPDEVMPGVWEDPS
jgi:DNA-binding transcriptional regulator LsrR (DeoR family)